MHIKYIFINKYKTSAQSNKLIETQNLIIKNQSHLNLSIQATRAFLFTTSNASLVPTKINMLLTN